MLTLGIEGTAHTVGVGIVDNDGRILSNEIEMYRPPQGGIHPREAANHHAERVAPVIRKALDAANLSVRDIELVAFSRGPGLGPCLRTVATAARALSISLGIPLMGVNHCIAHLEIGIANTGCSDPVLLYASGGNTQVIALAEGRYRIFGETLDIGIGNMFDKLGRKLGLGYYAGPIIERLAGETDVYHELPYSVKGMDVSFSGIMTAALALQEKGVSLPEICNSVQETCFAMLMEVAERAMAHIGKNELLLGGGVVQNKRLQRMAAVMTEERGARSYVPEPKLCADNGAMIALTGKLMYEAGIRMSVEESIVDQRFRTDEVEVTWRRAAHR
ncbi:MAG: N6-L-threonylcarbamoyladenine synthase [Candidatus Methanomethylophilaceae archaeon]|nr:N6-L-threonylcarbamoyladenine synthase [Candidatus Methanomethylophilaceae archaeon]MDI3541494.1 N6-L-threonylcarbamoyladenine synthase [Candidatus Methanomethylophilaceae archaeon]